MSESSDPWAVIRADYLVSLREQLDRLRELHQRMGEGGLEPDERDDLARRIHHLKGSGGCFGFPVLSTVAEAVEDAGLEDSDSLNELISHISDLLSAG